MVKERSSAVQFKFTDFPSHSQGPTESTLPHFPTLHTGNEQQRQYFITRYNYVINFKLPDY
jgi:hypothetical protein